MIYVFYSFKGIVCPLTELSWIESAIEGYRRPIHKFYFLLSYYLIGQGKGDLFRRTVSGMILVLLLISMEILILGPRPSKASDFGIPPQVAYIYIRANGSVEPPTAPIQRNGDLYTLTGDLGLGYTKYAFFIERNNMTFDGAGHQIYTPEFSLVANGMTLSGRNNVTIKNTFISGPCTALCLGSSSNNSIIGNDIYSIYRNGLVLGSSSNNSIIGNRLYSNYVTGTLLSSSSNNSIIGNTLRGGDAALALYASSNNSIIGNDIHSSDQGIFITGSTSNFIFHNNFINNYEQVIASLSNVWDNGYPLGGNYWSDYTGVDLYCGPYQNETGSDGIGDTPHLLAPSNQDNYPFMNRCYEFDIAIMNILPSKTVVNMGDPLPINVTIRNEGLSPSSVTFNITLEATYIYTPQVLTFKLQGDSSEGWNHSIPGPMITVYLGDTISMTLETADHLHHMFYVDYNGNAFPDTSEPQSSPFIDTTSVIDFEPPTAGQFTYYCAYYQDTMFGSLVVNESDCEPKQIGFQTVTFAKSEETSVTFAWNTSGFVLGNYTIKAYVDPISNERDTTDNTITFFTVQVVPEFPSAIVMLFLMALSVLVAFATKRRSRKCAHL